MTSIAHKSPAAVALATDVSPEQQLGLAIVRQAQRDLHDPAPHIRDDAARFFHDPPTLQFWDDLLSLSGRLVRQGAALLVLACTLGGCVPPPNSEPARWVDKAFGVPSEEEKAFCRVTQEWYLKQVPPQLPPSCSDLLKAHKAQTQEVKP